MNLINSWVGVLTCMALLAGGCEDKKAPAPVPAGPAQAAAGSDQDRIQGTWKIIGLERDDRGPMPAAEVERKSFTWNFAGDQLTDGSARTPRKGTFKLGSAGTAGHLDAAFAQDAGGDFRACYELAADKLVVYVASTRDDVKRPPATRGAMGVTVLTFQREVPPTASANADREKLLGTWTLVSIEENGKVESVEPSRTTKWTFAGETFTENGRGTVQTGKFEINAQKTPAELTIEGLASYKGESLRALYEVSGDSLRVAMGDGPGHTARPPTLASTAKDVVLLTFKRN